MSDETQPAVVEYDDHAKAADAIIAWLEEPNTKDPLEAARIANDQCFMTVGLSVVRGNALSIYEGEGHDPEWRPEPLMILSLAGYSTGDTKDMVAVRFILGPDAAAELKRAMNSDGQVPIELDGLLDKAKGLWPTADGEGVDMDAAIRDAKGK